MYIYIYMYAPTQQVTRKTYASINGCEVRTHARVSTCHYGNERERKSLTYRSLHAPYIDSDRWAHSAAVATRSPECPYRDLNRNQSQIHQRRHPHHPHQTHPAHPLVHQHRFLLHRIRI